MDFAEILNKAWKIVWKFKVLWIFGIFAGCARGGGASGNSGYRAGSAGTSGPTPQLPPGFENNIQRFLGFFANPGVIAAFVAVIIVIILLSIFFSIVGRIGLIKGAVDADAGAEHLSFRELWRSGLHFFWRLLGLSLLIGSPALLFYLILVAGGVIVFLMYLSNSQNSSLVAAAPALLALIPVICVLACMILVLAVVISLLGPQAERAIVIENEGVISGLRRGWNVLRENLGPILIIWLILLVITFVAGIVIALPLLIVLIPAFIAFMAGGGNVSYMPLIIAGLCVAAYIPVSVVANGILTAYLQSVWTLTFLRLTKPKLDVAASAALPANA
jgi:hypothetical protein